MDTSVLENAPDSDKSTNLQDLDNQLASEEGRQIER